MPVGNGSQLTLQVASSEPQGTYSIPDTSLDEDNGWPNVEGRVALGLGKPMPIGIGVLTQRPLEVSVSGVVGQLSRHIVGLSTYLGPRHRLLLVSPNKPGLDGRHRRCQRSAAAGRRAMTALASSLAAFLREHLPGIDAPVRTPVRPTLTASNCW